jgi:beta-glucanase (GH16 family)
MRGGQWRDRRRAGAILAVLGAALTVLAACGSAVPQSKLPGFDAATAAGPATGGAARPAVAPPPNPYRPGVGWTIGFGGAAGSPPDPRLFGFQVGGNGWGNRELETYTSARANSALDGRGHLVITARRHRTTGPDKITRDWTSARLDSIGKWSFSTGTLSARIRVPAAPGLWPAFWLLGDDITKVGWPRCGEIDVMENVGFEPNTVHGTIHGPGYSGSNGIGAAYSGPVFADGFHTYAVDWAPNSIKWSVDGHVYETRTPADVGGNQWAFNHPFYIILNLAVGGYWPGDPDSSTPFPAKLVVDYVHVTTG